MTIRMISLKLHVYAGKRLAVGVQFKARGESDARLLAALQRAEKVPAMPKQSAISQVGALIAAVPSAVSESVAIDIDAAAPVGIMPSGEFEGDGSGAGVAKPKRVYRRRDMTAED